MQYGALSSEERKILRFSVTVRAVTVLLALLTSLVSTPFDASGALALLPNIKHTCKRTSSEERVIVNAVAKSLLQKLALPFTQWDTIHFLAIAHDGYADEQKFAFLPGAPGLLAVAGRLPHILGLSDTSFCPAAAVISVSALATLFSCITPLVLYRLSLKLSRSVSFSTISSLLYVISPAPAIFSVLYTEPFYAFFTFSGMLYAVNGPKSHIQATACFAVAASFRANGLLNIGFLAWGLIWQMPTFIFMRLFKRCAHFITLSSFIALPFIAHQACAYSSFCTTGVDMARPWCNDSLPLVYSFVQKYYWNVGFLKYWTVQQIPNFLLAAPVLAVSFAASLSFYMHTWPAWVIRSLPFSENSKRHGQGSGKTSLHPFFSMNMLPFIHLHTILTLLLFFASHVQIALRQACTNPVIFWYAAYLVESGDRRAKWWTLYCVIWGSVSIVLWTLFYPPA